MKISLQISYDGTNYNGWQKQNNNTNGKVAIQNVIDEALTNLYDENIQTIGASRTDAGVHAFCQIAVYEAKDKLPVEKIAVILNQRLPSDIRIVKSYEVDAGFHPRYMAKSKTYEYKVGNSDVVLPIYRNFILSKKGDYDLLKMQTACGKLVGKHDFKGFSNESDVKDTVREIYYCNVKEEDGVFIFTIKGNGFLYNMIRIVVSTILEIGLLRKNISVIDEILLTRNRNLASSTEKAHPLILKEIEY
ncbi:MAG: tRNA pseudouridine(38-40) synthase TruA [Lachnospirales bacterium]